jgi:hypothetical protein
MKWPASSGVWNSTGNIRAKSYLRLLHGSCATERPTTTGDNWRCKGALYPGANSNRIGVKRSFTVGLTAQQKLPTTEMS